MSEPIAASRTAVTEDRRDDIQGMRALAVLMAVSYHAGLLPGGFTGPEVFFAVSGFVITGMLIRERRSKGRISIGNFYLRRARRLLPAMAMVTIGTLAIAMFALPPIGTHQRAAGQAALAASTITANLYFLQQTGGYFQPLAQENPFLHTWTLSVEEQFYLVFPITIFGLWWLERRWNRGGRGTTAILLFACLGSLGASVALSYGHVTVWWPKLSDWIGTFDAMRVAFFLPVTRAWEFLAGVLLCVGGAPMVAWVDAAQSSPASIGLGLLVLTIAIARSTDVFPGTLAILPVVGTLGMLIGGLGSPRPFVTRLLSLKPLVWIGDRSYGWYLWHWPLIVFARTLYPDTPAAPIVAAVVSLIPAMLSFRFVEEPIRRRTIWPSAKASFAIAAVSVATPIACAIGFAAGVDRAWGQPDLARIQRAIAASHLDIDERCASMLPLGHPARASCIFPGATSRGTVLLIGDSNAGHFSEPFIAAVHALGYDAQLVTVGGCPFLRRLSYKTELCREFVERSLAAITTREPAYAGIVVSNATMGYLDGPEAPPFVADGAAGAPITRPSEIAGWVASVNRTVDAIIGRSPVIVIGAVPQFYQVPQCLQPTLFARPIATCGVWTAEWAASWRTDIVIAERAAVISRGATYFDAGATLCPDGQGCSAFINGQLAYKDGGHLSVEGSMTFEPQFRTMLTAAMRLQ